MMKVTICGAFNAKQDDLTFWELYHDKGIVQSNLKLVIKIFLLFQNCETCFFPQSLPPMMRLDRLCSCDGSHQSSCASKTRKMLVRLPGILQSVLHCKSESQAGNTWWVVSAGWDSGLGEFARLRRGDGLSENPTSEGDP